MIYQATTLDESLGIDGLAKHFADTFSRIGLPRPYETL